MEYKLDYSKEAENIYNNLDVIEKESIYGCDYILKESLRGVLAYKLGRESEAREIYENMNKSCQKTYRFNKPIFKLSKKLYKKYKNVFISPYNKVNFYSNAAADWLNILINKLHNHNFFMTDFSINKAIDLIDKEQYYVDHGDRIRGYPSSFNLKEKKMDTWYEERTLSNLLAVEVYNAYNTNISRFDYIKVYEFYKDGIPGNGQGANDFLIYGGALYCVDKLSTILMADLDLTFNPSKAEMRLNELLNGLLKRDEETGFYTSQEQINGEWKNVPIFKDNLFLGVLFSDLSKKE